MAWRLAATIDVAVVRSCQFGVRGVRQPACIKHKGRLKLPGTSTCRAFASSGYIIDPYIEYYKDDVSPASIFTPEGWRQRWRVVKSKTRSGASIGHIRRFVPAFNFKTFPTVADKMFVGFHDAVEKGDLRRVMSLCTDDFSLSLRHQLSKTNRGKRRAVRFVAFTAPTTVVHIRHMLGSGSGYTAKGYGQITTVTHSRREDVEVLKDGRTVPVGPLFENDSICVFEVDFSDATHTWRLASVMEQPKRESAAAGMAGSFDWPPGL